MSLELTGQGLTLMAVGLSVVFIFLVAMIFVMMASAKVFIRYAHLLPEATQAPDRRALDAETDSGPVVAAIAAALLAGKR